MVFIVNCGDEITARKAKDGLPEGAKFIKFRTRSIFYISSELLWDALRDWGSKIGGVYVGIVIDQKSM